jgi:hypothetical protein
LLELLGQAHREFPIMPNKYQRPIHAWWVVTNSPTLLVEVEGSLLIRWVTHKVCGGEEKERNTRACSLASPRLTEPGQAWRDEARRWARAHDMHVNSLLKSSPKPHRSATSFGRLILL